MPWVIEHAFSFLAMSKLKILLQYYLLKRYKKLKSVKFLKTFHLGMCMDERMILSATWLIILLSFQENK